MRVISQNGLISVPFEMTVIHVAGTFIKMNMVGDTGKRTVMAEYNTPEKAEKAMQLLHKAYSGMPIIFQNAEIPEVDADQLKGILNCSIIASIPNEPSKVEYINRMIFQFPKEEDLL